MRVCQCMYVEEGERYNETDVVVVGAVVGEKRWEDKGAEKSVAAVIRFGAHLCWEERGGGRRAPPAFFC